MDKDKRKLEDRAAAICFVLSLGGMLGALYSYSLGKQVGKLTRASDDSAHLPAEESEDAHDPTDPDEGE